MANEFTLNWDAEGERFYETGVDRGVLYVYDPSPTSGADPTPKGYSNGVAWNGLSSVSENPSGGEATPVWADNIKYLNLYSAEEYGATVECYTYPDEFKACNGEATLGGVEGITIGQQERAKFGFAYRTLLGNDVAGNSYGYIIHLIYGAKASPSEESHSTVNDSPEASTFSYELTTTPVNVSGMKPTATLEIDSTKVTSAQLTEIETILYGDGTNPGRLPLPDEIITILTTP